jgi:hypothetical protein
MERSMKHAINFALGLVLLSSGGCFCITKAVLSGNGNVNTGVVGGRIDVTACTPLEKEVANQLKVTSDWYRVQWEHCATNPNPVDCRTQLAAAYKEQKQMLLDILDKMKGKPKEEQKALYEQMLLQAKFVAPSHQISG